MEYIICRKCDKEFYCNEICDGIKRDKRHSCYCPDCLKESNYQLDYNVYCKRAFTIEELIAKVL